MPPFDLDRIRQLTLATHIDFHDELASTNSHALAIAAHVPAFPTLVLADRQTAGRGRGSNRWWAGEGGLTLSLLFHAADFGIAQQRWPLLSLATGLAVAEAVASFVPSREVQVKWPNDVLVGGRKICGILIEIAPRPAGAVVLGIGLNVNNSFHDAPDDVARRAITLADAAGNPCDRTEVLIGVLKSLAECLELLRSDPLQMVYAWRDRCYLRGRQVQIDLGPATGTTGRIQGACLGIADDGALLVQTETGVARCVSGVVSRID